MNAWVSYIMEEIGTTNVEFVSDISIPIVGMYSEARMFSASWVFNIFNII